MVESLNLIGGTVYYLLRQYYGLRSYWDFEAKYDQCTRLEVIAHIVQCTYLIKALKN